MRLWLDAGFDVAYVQNSTDVDDPLLERALARGVDWRELAAGQTDRFRRRHGGAAASSRPTTTSRSPSASTRSPRRSKSLADRGFAYVLDGDYYFDSAAVEAAEPWMLGDESRYDRALMLALSAERGGDPDRPGKRDPLDPLLWRAEREGEPSWPSVVGAGRPGWHIECSVISAEFLDLPLTVQGGGADLIFPHHEFTAGHTIALTGSHAGVRLLAHRTRRLPRREDEQVARQPGARRRPDGGGGRSSRHPARDPRPALPRQLGMDRRAARRGDRPPRSLDGLGVRHRATATTAHSPRRCADCSPTTSTRRRRSPPSTKRSSREPRRPHRTLSAIDALLGIRL